jgi:peptide/nickel transport system substrate-binding protein
MSNRRQLRLLACGAALGLALAGSMPLWAQAPQPRGTIQISLNADIRSTNPGVNRDANTDTVMMHIVEGLVAYRENATPAPLLADSIEVTPDGTTYTFRLRPNVRFHNGATLSAADVVWAWRRYLDPKTGWNCLGDFDGSRGTKIESVTALDTLTVVFRLNRAQPMLLTQMAALPCGASAIVHRDSVDAAGRWQTPIGTGPYRLGEWKRGQYLDLLAFPDYASRGGPRDGFTGGKIAYAATLHWLIIRDDAARRAALIKGQIDLLPELAVSEFAAMRKLPHVDIKTALGLNANALLIQTRDPLLANKLLRQALAYSLDTSAIAELASGGASKANPSMVPTVSPYHSAVHERGYGHNLQRARQLLAQSGYKGEPIALLTNRRYPDMYDQALMIQSMARDAGINIELQISEWATQLDRYQSGNFQLMSFSYTARADAFLSYESMLGDRSKSKRKLWDNPQAIALEEQAGNTADPAARQALFERMHLLMLEDVPLIMLFNPADVNAVNRSLDGFASWPLGRARLWNVRRLEQR